MNQDSIKLLGTLFPFHIRMDPNGLILEMGPSLVKSIGNRVGQAFLACFEVKRPRLTSIEEICSHQSQLTLINICGTDLQMRGQFLLHDAGEIIFAGSPRIVSASSIWAWPVGISDFAPHDGSADYAMVIEATNSQMTDLERLVEQLRNGERTERELRQLAEQASRTKTNFLANISHEIRTPMTAILGYTELLRDPRLDPSERSDHIETIRRNGDHLLAIINDILDLSKIEAGKFDVELSDVVVPDVVRDVVKLLHVRAVSHGISLTHVVEGDDPYLHILSDPVRIRQVLLNIIGNAVKFTDQGSVRVVVSAAVVENCLETRIAVQDTGCGMSELTLSRLFEPFSQSDSSYTRKHGGSGLGLAISKRLALLLDGRIDVKSELNRGSEFIFIFKSALATSAPLSIPVPEAIPRSDKGPLDGMHVLLVEDSIDSQRILSALMTIAGARVDVACDGCAAVACFDGKYQPHLVIMDVQMPGIDGIEATRRIRKLGYQGRIVALTAAALSIERERALAAGCEGFYLKPISRVDLLALCKAALPAVTLHS